MFVIQIILALLACAPLVTLAAPHAMPQADGTNFAFTKDLTNEFPAASKLYSGPWSNFPKMSKWTSFDNMVSASRQTILLLASSSPGLEKEHARLPLEI